MTKELKQEAIKSRDNWFRQFLQIPVSKTDVNRVWKELLDEEWEQDVLFELFGDTTGLLNHINTLVESKEEIPMKKQLLIVENGKIALANIPEDSASQISDVDSVPKPVPESVEKNENGSEIAIASINSRLDGYEISIIKSAAFRAIFGDT